MHRQRIRQLQRIVTGPLATRRTHATTRRPDNRTRTAQIKTQLRQLRKRRLQFIRPSPQQNNITRRAVHIRQTRTAPLPNITNLTQHFRVIKPTRRHIHAHRMKMRHLRKILRQIRITTDHTSPVTQHTNNTAMLPVADAFIIRALQLPQQILRHLILLSRLFNLAHKTRPTALLQFIQHWRLSLLYH